MAEVKTKAGVTVYLAYDESERGTAYGVFSGCSCKVSTGWTPKKRNSEEPLEVDSEYKEFLKGKCERYLQKDNHTYSNWNRNIKLPYGEWQRYGCAYLQHEGSCLFSLRQEKTDDADFQEEYLREL
jgi:hypothetical protein